MKRRDFIKKSSLITLPLLLKSCDWQTDTSDYPITVHSDATVGHLLLNKLSLPTGQPRKIETLVVGGGVAGMAAACELKEQGYDDFKVYELSTQFGGSSSSIKHNGLPISQGAHYDLAYPKNYGTEVLRLLERLEIIKYQPWKQSWGFNEEQHLIMHRRKNQCFDHGVIRRDVLAEGPIKNDFLKLILPFSGQMVMPTRSISKQLHQLNDISFLKFLEQNLSLTPDFTRGIDYHMKDDYGAEASSVSALAGIHYFACRPYYNQVVELFSPPQGNYYFIEKMKSFVGEEHLVTQQLISKIVKKPNSGFAVEVIDIVRNEVIQVNTNQIIYAGQKHALKYVFPDDGELFATTGYAPWIVVNVICTGALPTPGYCQNEMLTEDETFLGFIDSDTQNPGNRKRVFTAYYCLPPESRNDLINVESNKVQIAQATIDKISMYFDQDLKNNIEAVHMKAMGHAMPIPSPGYLFDDKNHRRSAENLVYAGVDNSRLPLLFEAMDSGIEAVRLLKGKHHIEG